MQPLLALLRVDVEQRAEAIAEAHDRNPWKQRIRDESVRDRSRDMQQRPQRRPCAETLRVDAVEQVVSADDHDAENSNRAQRQMDEHSQHHHRNADRPDHLQEQAVVIAHVERPDEAHQRDFEHDQPQAAREQEPAQLRARAMSPGEIRADACEQHERRRTEVRDPASEKQWRVGLRQVERIEAHVGEEIADVIQRHQHHHQAAQDVDRRYTRGRMRCCGCVRDRRGYDAFEPGGHCRAFLAGKP